MDSLTTHVGSAEDHTHRLREHIGGVSARIFGINHQVGGRSFFDPLRTQPTPRVPAGCAQRLMRRQTGNFEFGDLVGDPPVPDRSAGIRSGIDRNPGS